MWLVIGELQRSDTKECFSKSLRGHALDFSRLCVEGDFVFFEVDPFFEFAGFREFIRVANANTFHGTDLTGRQ